MNYHQHLDEFRLTQIGLCPVAPRIPYIENSQKVEC